MAITAKIVSLGDHNGERGTTQSTALQSPAVFNFLAVIDDKSLPYMFSEKVGCSWNFGDDEAKSVKYGPRAGQTTNTLFGCAQAGKVFRVPLGGGVEPFTVKVAIRTEDGDEVEVSKTVYVKAADSDKSEVVAYSPTLDTSEPDDWVGVPEGATLVNGVPDYDDFSDKLIMFEGGATFDGNNGDEDVMQVKIDQTDFAITSFGSGRAILPPLWVGVRNSFQGQFENMTLRDSDIEDGTLENVNISSIRTPRINSPTIYDDLTFVDIDADYSNEEVDNAGAINCLSNWNAPYVTTDLSVENTNFSQKFFLAESVFKGMSVPDLAYNGDESGNVFDFTDYEGRTVVSFTIDGDPTTYTAPDTATITDIGDLEIKVDGTYDFSEVSSWDFNNDRAVVRVTDSEGTVSKYHIGKFRPVINVSGINASIINMVVMDVQCANSREHNMRQMGNQFFLTQDCDVQAGYTDRSKHCLAYRNNEYASPTELPNSTKVTFGTTEVDWHGGHARSLDDDDFRVLPGMRYATRQYLKCYVDNSVDASNPFTLACVIGSSRGRGNVETGIKYIIDYNNHFEYEDISSSMHEYLATRIDDTVDDLNFITVVKTTTDKTAGADHAFADANNTYVDHDGDLPQASLSPIDSSLSGYRKTINDRKAEVLANSDFTTPLFDYSFNTLRGLGYTGNLSSMLKKRAAAEGFDSAEEMLVDKRILPIIS